MHILFTFIKLIFFPIMVQSIIQGDLISFLSNILTPAVVLAILDLTKYCIGCYVQYKELELLVASGKEHITVTKDGISYGNQEK